MQNNTFFVKANLIKSICLKHMLGFYFAFFASFISVVAYAEVATATAPTTAANNEFEDIAALPNGVKQQAGLGALPNVVGSAGQNAAAPNKTAAPYVAKAVDNGNGQILPIPQLTAPVTDLTNTLSQQDITQLNQQIYALYQKDIAQIAILMVNSTSPEEIFSYAMRTAETWKLGSKDKDNGVLIVVALQDRRVKILTGYGVEGAVPDVIAKRIISNTITPAFKQGQYGLGLQQAISQIQGYVTQDESLTTPQKKTTEPTNLLPIVVTFILCLVLGFVASKLIGRFFGAGVGSGVGVAVGLFAGLATPIALGVAFFAFIIVLMGLANFLNLVMQLLSSGGGRGGFGGGGGGGYSGGGGGFGGGGASGSW